MSGKKTTNNISTVHLNSKIIKNPKSRSPFAERKSVRPFINPTLLKRSFRKDKQSSTTKTLTFPKAQNNKNSMYSAYRRNVNRPTYIPFKNGNSLLKNATVGSHEKSSVGMSRLKHSATSKWLNSSLAQKVKPYSLIHWDCPVYNWQCDDIEYKPSRLSHMKSQKVLGQAVSKGFNLDKFTGNKSKVHLGSPNNKRMNSSSKLLNSHKAKRDVSIEALHKRLRKAKQDAKKSPIGLSEIDPARVNLIDSSQYESGFTSLCNSGLKQKPHTSFVDWANLLVSNKKLVTPGSKFSPNKELHNDFIPVFSSKLKTMSSKDKNKTDSSQCNEQSTGHQSIIKFSAEEDKSYDTELKFIEASGQKQESNRYESIDRFKYSLYSSGHHESPDQKSLTSSYKNCTQLFTQKDGLCHLPSKVQKLQILDKDEEESQFYRHTVNFKLYNIFDMPNGRIHFTIFHCWFLSPFAVPQNLILCIGNP